MADYSDYKDEDLMLLLRQDPEPGFTEIYRRYWRDLLDSANKRLNSIQEAEELVQELFVDLFVRRDLIAINTSLHGFLRKSLKNRILNIYRSRYTREAYAALMLNQRHAGPLNPEQHFQVKELQLRIKHATGKLPEKCRAVFLLSRVDGLSNKSIAEKLGISVSTVEKHLTKAMRLLKSDFTGYDSNIIIAVLIIFFHKG